MASRALIVATLNFACEYEILRVLKYLPQEFFCTNTFTILHAQFHSLYLSAPGWL